jgi:hypothetical protein
MKEKIKSIVWQIIALLVGGDFQRIVELTKGVRMSSEDIKAALEDYGRILITPPQNAFDLLDIVEVKNSRIRQFSIRMPLWTREEGRSDLTLELTLKASDDNLDVELDDIHVL